MGESLIYIKRVTCPIYLKEIKDSESITREIDDAKIVWYDGIFRLDKYIGISPSKYMNKIPGMNEVCYKYNLYQLLQIAVKKKAKFSKYIPKTFLIPEEKSEFLKEFNNESTWIMKPGFGYGGKDIEILQNPSNDFLKAAIIQKYIEPYLIDEHKFDLRLHILIVCIDPLDAYICKEGIARFCSEKYSKPSPENFHNKYQHLTNSCLNCKNDKLNGFMFIREASMMLKKIEEGNKGQNHFKYENLWKRIKDVCSFVIYAIQDIAKKKIDESCESNDNHNEEMNNYDENDPIPKYERFFHLLGIDVLIGADGNPYVLELNDNPAMKHFSEKDEDIKMKTVQSEIDFILRKLKKSDNGDKIKTSPDSNYEWEKLDFQFK